MKKIMLFSLLLILTNGFAFEKCTSLPGNCEIIFVDKPFYQKKIFPLMDDNKLMDYHLYLSCSENDNSIYMMVIAKYPFEINSDNEVQVLESFLSGMLNNSDAKILVNSNLEKTDFNTNLHFLIKENERNFIANSFVHQNMLYLIALESENENFKESFENYFKTFHFTN